MKLAVPLLLAGLLAACGGGGGREAPLPPPTGQIALLAHSMHSAGSVNAVGTAARFSSPADVVQAPDGSIYVADLGNRTIRKIATDGTVSTFAGAPGQVGSADGIGGNARFGSPMGITVDAQGNLYVADRSTIRRITPAGAVATIAGSPDSLGVTDGPGPTARFTMPGKMALDSRGNLFVADGPAIRRIAPDGTVATAFGSMVEWGYVVGDGTNARFEGINGIAIDAADNIYVAERIQAATPNGRFRRFDKDGRALAWGTAPQGVVSAPNGADLAFDSSGQLLVISDGGVQRITADGALVRVAGALYGNDDGSGNQARFAGPSGIAAGLDGGVLVTDSINHNIRRVSAQGVVSTVAGDPTPTAQRIWSLRGVAPVPEGSVYVAETAGGLIRRVQPDGSMSTVVVQGGQAHRFEGLAVAGNGRLVVSYVEQPATSQQQGIVAVVEPGGALREIDRRLSDDVPWIAAHADGRVFVASGGSIAVVQPDGRRQELLAGVSARGLAVAADGTVFFTEHNRVRALDPQGNVRVVAATGMELAGAITLDGAGNLYVVDIFKIHRINPDGSMQTVAGHHHGAETVAGPLPGSIGSVQSLAWSGGFLYATTHNALMRIGPMP